MVVQHCVKCGIPPLVYAVDYNIIFDDSMGYAYQCPNCNKSTEWHKTMKEAQVEWNEMNRYAP